MVQCKSQERVVDTVVPRRLAVALILHLVGSLDEVDNLGVRRRRANTSARVGEYAHVGSVEVGFHHGEVAGTTRHGMASLSLTRRIEDGAIGPQEGEGVGDSRTLHP
jgi:hypothetical protein